MFTVVLGVAGCSDKSGITKGDVGNDGTLKAAEVCNNGLDENKDGQVDEGCACTPGETQQCHLPAPSGDGTQFCAAMQACESSGQEFGTWNPCVVSAQCVAVPCPGCIATCVFSEQGQLDCANPACAGLCAANLCQPELATDAPLNAMCTDSTPAFETRLKWHQRLVTRPGNAPEPFNSYTTPLVANLDDDNRDGKIDAKDMPEVVVVTGEGALCVFEGDTGKEKWCDHKNNTTGSSYVAITPAIGDIDGNGTPDIVAIKNIEGLVAQTLGGRVLWSHRSELNNFAGASIAIADMEADGRPEILQGNTIYDGSNGHVRTQLRSAASAFGVMWTSIYAIADADLDGQQEVITGNAAYDVKGNAKWTNALSDGHVALGNFDDDDFAENVVVYAGMWSSVPTQTAHVRLQDHDGKLVWRYELGRTRGGGPPTIADFDGDGRLEIGVADTNRYLVLNHDGTLLWEQAITDVSSGVTGSSVFDFDGDGRAEVVYADERDLWVFDGGSGAVRVKEGLRSSGTRWESPVIADVDKDNHAEIVFGIWHEADPQSDYGLAVLEDLHDRWMPTRAIWNQDSYSITNVGDDGRIPRKPEPNWLTYNNFRSADLVRAHGGPLSDARALLTRACDDTCDGASRRVVGRLLNVGAHGLPSGVAMTLYGKYASGWVALQSHVVNEAVASGRSSTGVVFTAANEGLIDGELKLVADDASGKATLAECDESNNEARLTLSCPASK